MLSVIKSEKSADYCLLRINGHIPLYYLMDYLPASKASTSDFDADWKRRRLVWGFKNSDERISEQEHSAALDYVLDRIETVLRQAYGHKLDRMTLLCLPASSQEKTERRYLEFSGRLCGVLNMENAFDHIQVMREAVPKHEGGCGTPCIQIDPVFFRNKHVFLFDDVYTSGSSLRYYIRQMELRGAKVVGCAVIARTVAEKGRLWKIFSKISRYISNR